MHILGLHDFAEFLYQKYMSKNFWQLTSGWNLKVETQNNEWKFINISVANLQ